MSFYVLACDHIIERDSRPPKLVRCVECPKTNDGNPKRKLVGECTSDGVLIESTPLPPTCRALERTRLIERNAYREIVVVPDPDPAVSARRHDAAARRGKHVAEYERSQLSESQRRMYDEAVSCGATHADALEAGLTDGYKHPIVEPETSDDVELSAAALMERYRLAKQQHQAIKAWEQLDETQRGERPDTSALEALRADVAAGVRAEDRIVKTSTRSTSSAPKRERKPVPVLEAGSVQFSRNGAPLRGKHNRLSSLAGYCKIPVVELRQLLAAAGVEQPETSAWELTLPSGTKIAAAISSGAQS
jgi:hypothetical protein